MKKELICLEYPFKSVSPTILWNFLSTAPGLKSWFADDVTVSGMIYTFIWKKHGQEAELLSCKNLSYIRFHWLDDDYEDSYFEFRIDSSEITGNTVLKIIEYNLIDDIESVRSLWDHQCEALKRRLGIV